jgi:hypothetical protein
MSKDEKKYKKILYDLADSVSFNEDTSTEYLKENGVDFDFYISKGIGELEKRENNKQPRKITKNSFFKRAVLAAEIAHQLYEEKYFGHVKFQKIVYLCEQASNMNLKTSYSKQAAGPFDNKFMHTIDSEFKKQNWFKVELVDCGGYKNYKYEPLDGINKYKKYYENYFQESDEKIQWLINTFRKATTSQAELVATIYFCLNEIVDKKEIFSEELLFNRFYEWSIEKKKFEKDQIISALNWMNENSVKPKRIMI